MKTTYFAILLLCATAAGAQSQASSGAAQAQPAQGQSSSCGLACTVDSSTNAPSAPKNTKLPPNLAKLAGNKSDLDKVVCEAQETLGTRLGAKKVCMTVAQWLEFENDVKDQTRRIEILGHVSH